VPVIAMSEVPKAGEKKANVIARISNGDLPAGCFAGVDRETKQSAKSVLLLDSLGSRIAPKS